MAKLNRGEKRKKKELKRKKRKARAGSPAPLEENEENEDEEEGESAKPEDNKKMVGIILNVLEPWLKDTSEPEDKESFINLGCLVWNLIQNEGRVSEEEYAKMEKNILDTLEANEDEPLKSLITEMQERCREPKKSNPFLIADHQITWKGKDPLLSLTCNV